MGDWEHRHVQFALPQSGKPGGAPYWGSDFIVVVVDAHNGNQMVHRTWVRIPYWEGRCTRSTKTSWISVSSDRWA